MSWPRVHCLLLLTVSLLCACSSKPQKQAPVTDIPSTQNPDEYWYHFGAEISRYTLTQGRYGDQHQGEAVLIFVTEPFNLEKGVKSDTPAGPGIVPAIKMNATRDFNTGVYPYTTMLSTFVPMDVPDAAKATASVQEWCGMAYTQINRRHDSMLVRQYSYFESEGDTTTKLAAAALEDALFTRIRLGGGALPAADAQWVPSILHSRFSHLPLAVHGATCQITDLDDSLRELHLRYHDLDRELRVRYRSAFPYLIEGWTERYREGKGKPPVETIATRTHTRMLPYWEHNRPQDRPWRNNMGLTP